MSVTQSPAPKPLVGILKTESASSAQQSTPKTPATVQQPPPPETPAPTASNVEEKDDNSMPDEGAGEEGDEKPRPPWMRNKKFGYKVNKPLKRRRQNARLRKLLQPKSGIMVLNELASGVKFSVSEQINALSQTMYHVSTEIEGKVYTGQGMSKASAKQVCAENALKAIIMDKLSKSPWKMDTSCSGKGGNASGMSDGEESMNVDKDVEDDVPWRSLTSFAIYKLFLEWQSEGTSAPSHEETKFSGPVVQRTDDGHAPKPMKKIPPNPTDRHPVMLLNHLWPGVEFLEISRSGVAPHVQFTMQTTIDGKTYTGVGRNKKDAKKETAKAALAGALGIHYN